MKFKIITLGCKVNTYESEYILEKLLDLGFINDEDRPDIVIVNTCSVTNMADNKSLKMVRKIKRENPEAILVVCGCSSQNNQEKYKSMGIDILLGNRQKSKIGELLTNYIKTKEKYVYFNDKREIDFESMPVKRFLTHTRAFIKIQDGCDNFCSYCIIPYTRGGIRSCDFDEVICLIKNLVDSGHKEVVLTGIHTGSYNSKGKDFSDLLKAIGDINGLERIRISSIEITELDEKFLNELKNNKKIVDHIHIPIQSGSAEVLKRMNRKYDKDYFKSKIVLIRSIRPDISITTDCIVGHPYESDANFRECLEFCREIGFSKIHVFPYSIREGTAAARMPQVDNGVKKNRAKELIRLSNKLEEEYTNKFINKELIVLTEEVIDDYVVGHTSNYLKVYINKKYELNKFYKCRIVKIDGNICFGEVVE